MNKLFKVEFRVDKDNEGEIKKCEITLPVKETDKLSESKSLAMAALIQYGFHHVHVLSFKPTELSK